VEIAEMRARADYCLRWAAETSHAEMRVLWKAAAEAWEAAGYRIGQANLLIRQLEANRDPLAAPPRCDRPEITPPICPKCKVKMRFAGIEPHVQSVNLHQQLFACRCGAQEARTVTRNV
jgi:hypothetical protein